MLNRDQLGLVELVDVMFSFGNKFLHWLTCYFFADRKQGSGLISACI